MIKVNYIDNITGIFGDATDFNSEPEAYEKMVRIIEQVRKENDFSFEAYGISIGKPGCKRSERVRLCGHELIEIVNYWALQTRIKMEAYRRELDLKADQ